MMKALKTTFNVAALATGGTMAVWSGLGLALGGWSTADQAGGVDLNSVGILLCLAGAGLFAAGYRGVTKAAKADARKKDGQGPQPPVL